MCEGLRCDPIDALTAAIDAVVAFFGEAPTAALGEALPACRRQQDRLEAAFTQGAGRFASSREFTTDGAASAVSWLKANCRMSGGAAAERLNIARQLDQLEGTQDAFTRGDLGYHHAALIAKTAARVGAEAVRQTEVDLLQAAATFDPNEFSRVTYRLRDLVDPDGFLQDANRAYERRYLQVSPSLDGVVFIDGRLDPVGGAALQTALNALSRPTPDDPRKAEQRRADALVELCRRALDTGRLPEVGGQKPHLSVTVSAAALAGVSGAEAGELAWGGVVPNATVRRLACDASLSVIVLDERGEPLDSGRATRTIPPATRRALAARDGGCRFPGCDRPTAWSDGHHVQHWTDGGPTTLANLALLCSFHHHLVHEGGWQIERMEKGEWHTIPPAARALRPIEAASRSA